MGLDETNQGFIAEELPQSSQRAQKIDAPQEAEVAKEESQELPETLTTVSTGSSDSFVNNVTFIPGADKVDKDTWLNKNISPLLAVMILLASFGFFAYILNFDFSAASKLKDIIILLIYSEERSIAI